MTKLLSRTGQQSQEFNAYDANLEYPQYSMITYTGNVYRSNDLIPAGTPFATGNSGATWSLQVNGGGGGGNGTALINGTSNVVVNSNANITMSSNSVSNIVLVTASANSTITQTNTLLAEASANTITFGNVRGFSVGQTITSPGILPANTTISGISDRVVTVSEQLLANANVGTSFSVVGDLSQVQITGLSNLGPVGNVIISGGSNGQVLTTDGSGYLSWTTASSSEFVSETGTTELTNGALVFGSPAYSTVATINIPSAGTYLITYNIYGSASVSMSINAALFSPAVALISPSYATVSVTAAATTAPVLTSTFTIVATESGQYTLRVRQSASGADSFTIRNNANTSNSGQSHITWKKIAGLIPSTGSSVQYINTATSSNISIGPGSSTLVLNGILGNSGISYNTTTGVYTLTAGITYRLRADLSWSFPSNPTTSTATFFWADATSGSSLLPSTSGRSLSVTSTSPEYPKSSLDIVYTPSSNQQVKIIVNNLSTVSVNTGSGVVITQLGTTDVTGFVGVIQNEWNINNTYPSGTIVVKDSTLYQANESIPSGTPFVEGTTGATWRPIVGLSNTISNGNSNVFVSANSNVRISVAGNANIVTVTGTGANVAGTLRVTGNTTLGHVLPSANAAYDLGSNTAYWRDLYLTGNTIYLGNSTIKSANDIVLIKGLAITANGAAPVSPPQPGQLTVEGNLVAPNATISTTLTANVVTVTTANITSNLIVANANVTNLQSSNASLGNITVTNITVANGGNVQVSSIINGNSNIVIDANANIRMSANGTANVVDISAGTLRVNGNTTIAGNLTVQGTTTTVNAQSLSVQDPTIELGGGANDSPLITNDGRDRGTVLTTYGTGAAYTTSGITPTSNTTIVLTSTTGIQVGMNVGFAGSNAIPSGATVTQVNAGNIVISAALTGSIPDASTVAVGNDVVRFMGWDSSNSEFAFGSNVSNNNNVMTFNQLGNIRAGNVIVTGDVTTGTVSASAGITAANITSNANITAANITAANITANTNVTAANITANGKVTATNLEVTANATVANITANGTVTLGAVGNVKITGGTTGQYLQTDGNGNVTWSEISAGSTLVNGNSNVVVTANSNINFSSAGNANVLVVTGTGIAVSGTMAATSNVSGTNFIGAGHINGNSNVVVEANGNVTVSVAGNANIVQVSDGLVKINNTLSTTNFIANGNVTLGNAGNIKIEGGSNGQVLTTDGIGNLTWANAGNATAIVNGNSNVVVAENGNVTVGSAGNANILTVTGIGANIAGTLQISGQSNLGPIGNVIITGGNTGQVLTTDGNGVLSWTTAAGVGSELINGNSNVVVTANANVTISTAGVYAIVDIGDTGILIDSNLRVSGRSNIGPVGNVTITGGSNGQVLTTNGNGVLSWTTAASGGSELINGNSNVIVAANSNVSVSVAGNSNIVTVTGTGANVAGTLTVTGNSNVGNLGVTGAIVASTIDGTLTTASQPNITSVGTLSTLTVSGNTTTGNLTGANLVSANYVAGALITASQPNITTIGTLSSLAVTGNITAGNLTDANLVSANYIGGRLTTAAQPNVTSLGTLSGLTVSGNTTTGNLINANLVSANYFAGTLITANQPNITALGTLGNLSVTNDISAANFIGSGHNNGNSNVVVNPNGNVTISTAGVYAIVDVGDTGVLIDSNLRVSGQSNLGPVGNVKITGGSNGQVLTTNGNGVLTWATGTGGGSAITNGNSNVIVAANGNVTVGVGGTANVIQVAPTIMTVNGNALVTGNLTVQGTTTTVSAQSLNIENPTISLGGGPNGNPLTTNDGRDRGTVLEYYTTAPVSAFMGWDNSNGEFAFGSNVSNNNSVMTFNQLGNIRAGNIIAASDIAATTVTVSGNITADNLTGANLVSANYLTGTLTTAAQPNVTSLGTLTTLTVTGNITGGNITGGNLVTANYVGGTLTTAAQPNITSVGSLSSLTVTGNTTTGNLTGANLVSANFLGGTLTTAAQPNITSVGSLSSLTVTGNITAGNLTDANLVSANFLTGTLRTAAQPNVTSLGTLTSLAVTGNTTTGNLTGANLVSANFVTGTLTTAAQPNVTSVGTLTSLAVTGNTTTGNLTGANLVSANFLGGTLTTAAQPNVTSVGTLTSLAVTGNVTAGNLVGPYASGNSNVTITANGNITAYVNGNANARFTVTDTGANVAGTFNATGNVTGANFIGGRISNGNSNITLVNDGNIDIRFNISNSVRIGSTMEIFGSGGVNLNGQLVASGNITSPRFIGSTLRNSNSNIVIGDTSVGGNISMSVENQANRLIVTQTGIVVTGNIITSGGNFGPVGGVTITGGSNGQVLTTNGNGVLSWSTVSGGGNSISDGNSNVTVTTNGNITAYVNGNANARFTITSTGANVTGTFNATGNANVGNLGTTGITATGVSNLGPVGNVIITGGSNGQVLTTNGSGVLSWGAAGGSTIANGNSNVTITANGNVTTYIAGNANARFTITSTGVNVAGTFNATGNANVGNLGATFLTGTLVTAAQTNITSVGTLTGLTVSGSTTLGSPSLINISGGNNGSVLTTNGSGILSWQDKDYFTATRQSTVQTGIGANSTLIFNTNGVSRGSIAYNTSTGVVTLPGGKTYILQAWGQFSAFSDTTSGFLIYAWVLDSSNTIITGTTQGVVAPINRNTAESIQPQTMTIYSPSVDTAVKVRVTGAAGTAALQVGTSGITIYQL